MAAGSLEQDLCLCSNLVDQRDRVTATPSPASHQAGTHPSSLMSTTDIIIRYDKTRAGRIYATAPFRSVIAVRTTDLVGKMDRT